MFRRGSRHHQPLNDAPSASAQSAATRAFLSHQNATPNNLSSAAAAAALRSHTPPPTAVEDVQTKRMMQRKSSSASRASQGPPARTRANQNLRRSNSVGSMTSRTFRTSSPHRPSSSSGDIVPPPLPIEPVPPLPKNLPDRSAASTRPANVRSSIRIPSPSSPTGNMGRPPQRSTTSPVPRASSSAELERPGSRSSVNFSYPKLARPTSPRLNSPLPESTAARPTSPPPGRSLSPQETSSIQYAVSQVGNTKVKTKPKRMAPQSAEGSHLLHGGEGGRPRGTAVQTGLGIESAREEGGLLSTTQTETGESTPLESLPDSNSASETPPSTEDPVSHPESESPSNAEAAGEPTSSAAAQSRPRPKKRPSTVKEEPEAEERAEAVSTDVGSSPVHVNLDNQTASTDRSQPVTPTVTSTKVPAATLAESKQPPKSSASSNADRLTPTSKSTERSPNRPSSTSPNRAARFSDTVAVVGAAEGLHEPPPRSMSPAKPALKSSLSPDRRGSLLTPSEISDVTSVASDEGSRSGSRKKAAKVSFDDSAEVLGVGASPPTSPDSLGAPPSPSVQDKSKTKTNWFAFGRKKPGSRDTSTDDDFDEVLKPRPALPSFGSVRGKKEPAETAPVPEMVSDNESSASSSDLEDQHELAVSSDHAIGGILAAAAAEKPLSSQEGPAVGDTISQPEFHETSTDDKPQQVPTAPPIGTQKIVPASTTPSTATDLHKSEVSKPAEIPERAHESDSDYQAAQPTGAIPSQDRNESVPVIAVQPATPGLEDDRQSLEIEHMPGGFPAFPPEQPEVTPSLVNAVKETPSTPVTQTPRVTTIDFATGTASTVGAPEDDDDSSGESVYSDAAEEPDMEGDGFGSINAIVDSPLPVQEESPLATPDSPTRPSRFRLSEVPSPAPSPGILPTPPSQTRDTPSDGIEVAVSEDDREQPEEPEEPEQPTALPPKEASPSTKVDPGSAAWPLMDNPPTAGTARLALEGKSRPMSAGPIEGSHLRNSLRDSQAQVSPASNRHSLSAAPRTLRQPRENQSPRMKSAQTTALPGRTEKTGPTLRGPNPHTGFANSPRKATSIGGGTLEGPQTPRQSPRRDGQVRMRRTMRSGAGAVGVGATTSPQIPSPERPERPLSARGSSMRTTLRGPGSGAGRPSSFAGRSKEPAPRSRPKSSILSGSAFKSRFNDSDDEMDAGRPTGFMSRFGDSSDEDEPMPTTLRPVRGIPRGRGERDQDSTDLEDSSDDEGKNRKRSKPAASAQDSPSSRALMTPQDVELYLSQPKKRSLLSRLTTSRKSRADDRKVRKTELDSAARRDTPLERTRSERELMKKDWTVNGHGGSSQSPTSSRLRPTSPKLQKRSASENVSWPLHSTNPPPDPEEPTASPDVFSDRPRTADSALGVNGAPADSETWASRFRPKLQSRRLTSSTVSSGVVSEGGAVGRTGRKKRFPLLRKAFGLRD